MSRKSTNTDKKEFIDIFKKVCALFKFEDENKAVLALSDLYDKCEPHLKTSVVITPLYATHDEKHVCGLAKVFLQIAEKMYTGKSKIFDLDCTVMLFSSFLLHDIGMSILTPEFKDDIKEELWQRQINRKGHDKRSLDFINKMIKDELLHLHNWAIYWSREGKDQWAQPNGEFILFVIARICQSHGDSYEDWLEPKALKVYYYEGEERNFEHIYSKVWNTKLRDMVTVCSGLLSLCDLCDIGPSRFQSIPGPLLYQALPKDKFSRSITFNHWLAHQVSKIKFGETIVVQVNRSMVETHVKALLIENWGPVADLLSWGNDNKIRKAIGIGNEFTLKEITVDYVSVDRIIWDDIADQYKKWFAEFKISAPVKFNDNNDEIEGNYILPNLFNLIKFKCEFVAPKSKKIQTESNDPLDEALRELFFLEILKIIRSGFSIEHSYDFDNTLDLNANFFALRINHAASDFPIPEEFLAALQLISNLISSKRPLFPSFNNINVEIAYKGSALYSSLRQSDIEHKDLQKSFIIVIGDNDIPNDEIEEISTTIIKQNLIGIFLCSSNSVFKEVIEIKPNKNKLKLLSENFVQIAKALTPSSIENPTKNYLTPIHLVHDILMEINGFEAWRKWYNAQLVTNVDKKREAQSAMFILIIVDLCLKNENGIPYDYLKKQYLQIAEIYQNDTLVKDFDSLFDIALNHISAIGHADRNVFIKDKNVATNIFKEIFKEDFFIILSSCFLFRTIISGNALNLHSDIFNISLSIESAIDQFHHVWEKYLILFKNKKLNIKDRKALAFGLIKQITDKENIVEKLFEWFGENIETSLTTYEGMMAFQMAYFHAEKCIISGGFNKLKLSNYPLQNLGILEAICSRYNSPEVSSSKRNKLIKDITDKLFEKRSNAEVKIMAFDILTRYANKHSSSKLKDTIAANFTSKDFQEWSKIASYFQLNEKPEKVSKGSLSRKWAEIRRHFQVIVDDNAYLNRDPLAPVHREVVSMILD